MNMQLHGRDDAIAQSRRCNCTIATVQRTQQVESDNLTAKKKRHTVPNDVPPLVLFVRYLACGSGFACFHGLVNLGCNLFAKFGIVSQNLLRCILTLAKFAASVAIP